MVKTYNRKCEGPQCKNAAEIIHHRDKNRKNNDPTNLRYLCRSCHSKEHTEDRMMNNPETPFGGRPRDLCDDIQKHKAGYRIEAGMNMLRDDTDGYNYDND